MGTPTARQTFYQKLYYNQGMDLEEFQSYEGEALKDKIRSFSRERMDETLKALGAQYAQTCQRLEALYTPDRLDLFIRLRPGGMEEIDKAIQETDPSNKKEIALLQFFRELNRIINPFMDVYEEMVFSDIQHMSKDELEALRVTVNQQVATAQDALKKASGDYRAAQNASGTLRLATLMKDAIERELKTR